MDLNQLQELHNQLQQNRTKDVAGTLSQSRRLEERIGTLRAWLKSMPLKWGQGVLEGSPAVFGEAWVDGVAVCDLIGFLESIKGGMNGVEKRPKSVASCRHNISKALERLRQKKGVPTASLFCEDAILQGNVDVVVPVLESVKKAYGRR
mmetsp:Transcript_42156/g.66005  ORF Transcript_42156/g.66005 Transcript_42156/m.66005 type:complete len:149 (+) Transcript_42156:1750-2196(+)